MERLASPAELAVLADQARLQIVARRLEPRLSALIEALGDGAIAAQPWLLLHQGRRCLRLHSDFARAHGYVGAAWSAFTAAGNAEGALWALTEWVVCCYHARDYHTGLRLARQALDASAASDATLSPYLRAELLFGCFLCLIGLDRLAESVAAGEAALAALDHEPDPWLQRIGRIQMLRNLAAGYHYRGAARRAVWAAETAVRLASEDLATADMEPWCYYELGLAYWRKGEFALASQALNTTRRLAETWEHRELWCWAVALQGHLLRDQNDLAAAHEAYRLAESWGEDIHGPTFLFIREGKLAEARWSCEALLRHARQIGSAIFEADARVLQALIDLRAGRAAAGLAAIDQAAGAYRQRGYAYPLASSQLYRSILLFNLERYDEADADLAAAMRWMAREDVATCDWWLPDLMEMLLVRAIQRGIEPHHARRILDRRFLNAPLTLAAPRAASARPGAASAELEIARQTQVSLLPTTPPYVPGLDIAGLSIPAEDVGGDFYGYYPFGADPAEGQRQFGVAVGDISGKGLQSALLTSGTVVALSTAVVGQPPPGVILGQVHTALRPFTSRSRLNVALCYAVLRQQPADWSLSAANAGGIPPLVRRADGSVAWIDAGGLPLGSAFACDYREVHTTLAPGELLLLVSDGVVEAMNADREMFGFERLEQALACAPTAMGARAAVTHILTAVQTHAANAIQNDDLTIVAVQVQGGTT